MDEFSEIGLPHQFFADYPSQRLSMFLSNSLLLFFLFLWAFQTTYHAKDPKVRTLRINVRMVEVYAAVFDERGRYIPGLTMNDFEIEENGQIQSVQSFESSSSALTLALLVDTTGSMLQPLPHVKNAVADLLTQIKPQDRFGLFSFNNRLKVLVPFTKNRRTALRALFRMRATGSTALFDSLAQLAPHLARVTGKKAILLFTDGEDTSSVLSMEDSVRTIKRVGIPVYTISQGRALKSRLLLDRLEDISDETGGVSFRIKRPEEIGSVFSEIVKDLQHLYLLSYYPLSESSSNNRRWRKISVRVRNSKGITVRSKEGYLP